MNHADGRPAAWMLFTEGSVQTETGTAWGKSGETRFAIGGLVKRNEANNDKKWSSDHGYSERAGY